MRRSRTSRSPRSACWSGVRSSPSRCCCPAPGRAIGPSTRAVFVTAVVRAAGTWTTSVICGADAPTASPADRVQVTCPALSLHDQPGPSALTNVVPAGTASVTTIGPPSHSGRGWRRRSCTWRPGRPRIGPLPRLVESQVDRPAGRRGVGVAVVGQVGVVGAGADGRRGSGTSAPSSVLAGIATVTVIGGKLEPDANVSAGVVRVQVIWVSPLPHDQPGPAALADPIPPGRSSTTVNGPTAVSAPRLDTTTVYARLGAGEPRCRCATCRS